MTDAISITNGALYRLGEKPILSFDEGTKISDACQTLYPVIRDDCLVRASWSFATVRQRLSLLAVTPQSDFDRYFALPTSPFCLQVIEPDRMLLGERFRREVYVNPLAPNDQQAVIATDALSMTLTYLGRVSEGLWHPAFVRYVILALATELSQTLTGKANLGKLLADERDRQLMEAKNKIPQEGTPRKTPLPTSYLTVRNGHSAAPTRVGE